MPTARIAPHYSVSHIIGDTDESSWSDDPGVGGRDAPERSRSRSASARAPPGRMLDQRLRSRFSQQPQVHYASMNPEDDSESASDSRERKPMGPARRYSEPRRRSTYSGTQPSFVPGGQIVNHHHVPRSAYPPPPPPPAPPLPLDHSNPFAPVSGGPPLPPQSYPHHGAMPSLHRGFSDFVHHPGYGPGPGVSYGPVPVPAPVPEPSFHSGSTRGHNPTEVDDLRQHIEDIESERRQQEKRRRDAAKKRRAREEREARERREHEKDIELNRLKAEIEDMKKSRAPAAAPAPPAPPSPEALSSTVGSESYLRGMRDFASMMSPPPREYDMGIHHGRFQPPPYAAFHQSRQRPPPSHWYEPPGVPYDDEIHDKVDGIFYMTKRLGSRLHRLDSRHEEQYEQEQLARGGNYSYPPRIKHSSYDTDAYHTPRPRRIKASREYSERRGSAPTHSVPSTRGSRSNVSARPGSASHSHSGKGQVRSRHSRGDSRRSGDFFDVPEESASLRDDAAEAEAQVRRLKRRQTPVGTRRRQESTLTPDSDDSDAEPKSLPAPPSPKASRMSKSKKTRSVKGSRSEVDRGRGRGATSVVVTTHRSKSRAAAPIPLMDQPHRSKSRVTVRSKSIAATHRSKSRPPQAIVVEDSDDETSDYVLGCSDDEDDDDDDDDDEVHVISRSRPYSGGLDPRFSRQQLIAEGGMLPRRSSAVVTKKKQAKTKKTTKGGRPPPKVPVVPPQVPFVSQSEEEDSLDDSDETEESLTFTSDDEALEDFVSRGRRRRRSTLHMG